MSDIESIESDACRLTRRLPRWFLWNFYCLRGRRCADVVARPEDTIPPGTIIHVAYTCAGCGTDYKWDSATFKRRKA